MMKFISLFGLLLTAGGVLSGPAVKVRFALDFNIGKSFFIEMPYTLSEAIEQGWLKYDCPTLYQDSLDCYCAAGSVTCCMMYDDNGNPGGYQMAINKAKFSDAVFDFPKLGYTSWTVTVNGTESEFWTTQQYYMNESYLAMSQDERLAAYDSDNLVQGDYFTITGLNGEPFKVPMTASDIKDVGFVEQSCVLWMGHHYYYNMTSKTELSDTSLFPLFPLVKSKKCIGAGYNLAGVYNLDKTETNYFENPAKSDVKMIVSNGPQWLYDLADSPGMVTSHVYFINDPYWITCLFQ